METTITFLTANFAGGKTIIAGKSYPSGTFAAALMQDLRYPTEPLALACKSSDSRNILAHALRDGSVFPENFIEAANNPIKRCYTSRRSCIRMEQSGGSITAKFAAAAKALAKEQLYHDAAKLLK